MFERHGVKSAAGPCEALCDCPRIHDQPRFLVLTGGPGAGKTPVLELARKRYCRHVRVLQESASILYGGGFPRDDSPIGRRAAQRAIYHLQRELERWAQETDDVALVLCDRGTLDGAAFWPEGPDAMWSDLETTWEAELSRYAAVICLSTPPAGLYENEDPMRIESAQQAAEIGERVKQVWSRHPHFHFVERIDFLEKDRQALELIDAWIPGCCRS